jgi:hypothetical protein
LSAIEAKVFEESWGRGTFATLGLVQGLLAENLEVRFVFSSDQVWWKLLEQWLLSQQQFLLSVWAADGEQDSLIRVA